MNSVVKILIIYKNTHLVFYRCYTSGVTLNQTILWCSFPLVAAPQITLDDKINIEKDKMVVYWEYNQNRRKRDSPLPVTIRVNYRKSGDVDYTLYPPQSEPAVSAAQGQVTIPGDFSTEASYKVKLAIYEGDVPIPSQYSNPKTTKPVTTSSKSTNLIIGH